MNTEELTPIVTAHQVAISRHDVEMAEIREVLAATAKQQALNTQSIARLEASIDATNQNLHDEITNMAHALSALATTFDESSRRVELASQVTQASIERLVEALNERFRSNGH